MNAYLYQHRAILAPLLTLLVLSITGAIVLMPIKAKQASYEHTIATIQPRIERLQGLRDVAPELQRRLDQAHVISKQLFYPATIDSNQLDTELTSRLRNLAKESGMTLSGMSPVPPRQEHGFDVFLLNLSLKGDISQLQQLLFSLTQPPRLWVDSLTIRKTSIKPGDPQTLAVEITIAALRRPAS